MEFTDRLLVKVASAEEIPNICLFFGVSSKAMDRSRWATKFI